ncbi:unnamed protein product [Triticum turgidum subsp. durum]|uniref:RING-type E3 ubiquitin transferase n=1 Tax=Triticum turgidum subsp. durum TaxID=4567 RepID=A0A9R0Y926_TRITD|nr:unnamed protein product [Triticum turgidum subsp. durum]
MSNSSWTAPSGAGAGSSALETVETKISPSILFIVAVLAIVFFVCGLLHLLARHLLRLRRRRRAARDDAESVTAFQGQLQQLFHLHDAGVDQAFIDALPVFLYRNVVVGGDGGGGGKDPFDCAVCLCEFAPDDQLRLLPKCSHAFHLECIDTWLLSHSTCPLCRRSLLAAGDLEPRQGRRGGGRGRAEERERGGLGRRGDRQRRRQQRGVVARGGAAVVRPAHPALGRRRPAAIQPGRRLLVTTITIVDQIKPQQKRKRKQILSFVQLVIRISSSFSVLVDRH